MFSIASSGRLDKGAGINDHNIGVNVSHYRSLLRGIWQSCAVFIRFLGQPKETKPALIGITLISFVINYSVHSSSDEFGNGRSDFVPAMPRAKKLFNFALFSVGKL